MVDSLGNGKKNSETASYTISGAVSAKANEVKSRHMPENYCGSLEYHEKHKNDPGFEKLGGPLPRKWYEFDEPGYFETPKTSNLKSSSTKSVVQNGVRKCTI